MIEESDTCLLCGSGDFSLVYSFNEITTHKKIGERRDIVKCDCCSLTYCHPRNLGESMIDVYENNYWQDYQTSVGELDIQDRVDDFEFISDERISFIQKNVNRHSGKFLDVGCSQGFLVNAAKKAGFDAYGIDLNQFDIDYGVEKYEVNLSRSLLHDYDNQDFDVICSFNVIEHVSDPIKFLQEKTKRLKDDGIIVIGTHDIECDTHRKEKVLWKHIIPNEHLYFFSIDTMDKLAEIVGLEKIYTHKPIDNGFTSYYRRRV